MASALALQFAPPGIADAEPSASSNEPAATASPTPTAGAISGAPQPAVVEPVVTEPPATKPPTNPAAETRHEARAQADADLSDPLAVRSYVDRGYLTKAYDAPLVISGGTAPYTATVSDVPPGLTFDPASLRFTGMPTQEGYFRMSVTVSDSSDPAQALVQEVTVDFYDYAPPQFRTATGTEKFTDGVVGAWYSESILVWTVGAQPYSTAVVAGALPPGMSWGQNAASGTPTAAGTYKFTVRFSDLHESVDAEFTLTVRASRPQPMGFAVPPAVLGEPYSAKIASVTGGVAPYDFWWATPRHMAGSLSWHDPGPDGLTIDDNGVLQGIPTRAGSFQIFVYFSDSGLYKQWVFSTVVTVLESRPPVVAQPPAANTTAALEVPDAPAPPTTVTPAGAVVPASGAELTSAELAATGSESGRLHTMLWAAAGLLTAGATLVVLNGLRRRRGSPA
ncbi:putative Ig domain-containing protein [Paenarthrobacter sp. FR1]|uniref:putative Ig domain-containing protein n=1 Tax=Paenarthrobacter sp. FR1 TaxID=3439548 RepID=UPI003DA51AA1